MPQVTLVFATLLILLGIIGYAGAPNAEARLSDLESASDATNSATQGSLADKSKRSITALIPSFTGGLLLVFGAIAVNQRWRMHAMHGAVLVGLAGFLAAGGRGVSGLAKLLSGSADVNTRSLLFVCTMAVLCGIYVALCVTSFVQARRRRQDAVGQPA